MPTEEQTFREGIIRDLQDIKKMVAYTNGSVADQQKQINSLLIFKATMEGAALPFKALWAIMIAAISGLLVWILTKR